MGNQGGGNTHAGKFKTCAIAMVAASVPVTDQKLFAAIDQKVPVLKSHVRGEVLLGGALELDLPPRAVFSDGLQPFRDDRAVVPASGVVELQQGTHSLQAHRCLVKARARRVREVGVP